MDYGALSRDLIADAFQNKLPGLTVSVVFHFLLGQGDYDAATGTYADNIENTDPIISVAARPSMDEVQQYGVTALDKKLIVPGKTITREIDENTTCTIAGQVWKVKKSKGVPGDSVFLVFVHRT